MIDLLALTEELCAVPSESRAERAIHISEAVCVEKVLVVSGEVDEDEAPFAVGELPADASGRPASRDPDVHHRASDRVSGERIGDDAADGGGTGFRLPGALLRFDEAARGENGNEHDPPKLRVHAGAL